MLPISLTDDETGHEGNNRVHPNEEKISETRLPGKNKQDKAPESRSNLGTMVVVSLASHVEIRPVQPRFMGLAEEYNIRDLDYAVVGVTMVLRNLQVGVLAQEGKGQ